MPGTYVGGLKARDKNLAKDPDFYRKIGKRGGKAPRNMPRGFAAMPPEKVSAAGRKGGLISKRRKRTEAS
ncbi:general stress protein [Mycolicibacterium neoaurum]|uniref:general stress protein n=1 Tax=Mycolicibacterium neoaurum TaxID=1795 RepID=UPI0034D51138